MHLSIKKIESIRFNKYGQFVDNNSTSEPDIKTDQVSFWKAQAKIFLGDEIEIGVLKVKKHDMVFNELENHFKTPTLLIALNGSYAIPVAPPSDEIPSAKEIEVFEVSEGQSILLKEKAWHGTTYPLNMSEITILVIFKKGTLDDDTVYKMIDEKCYVDLSK